ncbi:hypothetical protein [Mammaliicoccus sciuri]|uniref:hypothetical protein n=1 Tax=Mammaliicoccus sciuri TaxID=1296 RepID=UPI001E5EB241|nr:hypothetical protein [Mammaliicoccus sciuri]MCD8817620.1 hypothetical protein [Mammaliicoccus sciuri]
MGWRRCPRCNSGAVIEQSSSCLGCLVGVSIVFVLMVILGSIVSGSFKSSPFSTTFSIMFSLLIPAFFFYINIKFGYSLYCKSCEQHFKPNKK